MQYSITGPNKILKNQIKLPTSKSISNRVLIINALAYSPYEIENLSDSDDTRVLLKVFNSDQNIFDIGAAGTSMRFLTAYLSKIVGEWILTGSERMKQRPIGTLVEALRNLGANIEYVEKEGYPPLKITGCALQGGEIELEGNISSQYISSLLMIAPSITNGLTIKLTGEIISKPYIKLTLSLMRDFGIVSTWKDDIIIIPEQTYQPIPFRVEGDWSAASYWYEIIALSNNESIELVGLQKNSYQGDSVISELFNQLGVKTSFNNDKIQLSKSDQIVEHFTYNFIEQPDLAQTFAVTCCGLKIPFKFTGLQSLRIKETDRIFALIEELGKLGFHLTTNGIDTLEWDGTIIDHTDNQPVVINTYKDHRMAMSIAPLAMKNFSIIIDDPMVVTKSYPSFWNHLSEAGFTIIK